MAQPTELQIRTKVVDKIKAVSGAGRVWDHIRVATNDEEFQKYYIDDDGELNVVMVHFGGFTPKWGEQAPPSDGALFYDGQLGDVYEYEIRVARAIVDADKGADSENTFNLFLMAIKDAFKNDVDLGLDGTHHTGLRTIGNIPATAELGSYQCHFAVCGLRIIVEEC